MQKYTLRYLRSLNERGKNAMRTETIVGLGIEPREGIPFGLVSESMTPGAASRLFLTSPVVSVEKEPGRIVFRTQNSEYEVLWTEAQA